MQYKDYCIVETICIRLHEWFEMNRIIRFLQFRLRVVKPIMFDDVLQNSLMRMYQENKFSTCDSHFSFPELFSERFTYAKDLSI